MPSSPVPSTCTPWTDAARRALRRLNAVTLDAMRALAAGIAPAFPAIDMLRELAPPSRPDVLGRLVDCPFLLIEPALPAPPPRASAAAPPRHWPDAFPLPQRERVASSLVILLWQLARDSLALPSALSEATPADLGALVTLDSDELAPLAETLAPLLRPRWAERADVWRSLLTLAARPTEDGRLALTARGLQLLAGERLRARSPPCPPRATSGHPRPH